LLTSKALLRKNGTGFLFFLFSAGIQAFAEGKSFCKERTLMNTLSLFPVIIGKKNRSILEKAVFR
jgi:hypothetical protein